MSAGKAGYGRWIKAIVPAAIAAIVFIGLHKHGISPIWAAVAILFFRGIFRFMYGAVCLLVTVATVICILILLVF